MKEYINIIPVFVTLIAVVFDGYSMMSYRVSQKRSYIYFAVVTAFCLILNSYIIMIYGLHAINNSMIFTFSIPYLILILFITKDKISQTLFNFWLWTNIFRLISNLSAFINDYTLKSIWFLTVIRVSMLIGYYFLYHKVLKKTHKLVIEKLNVNWWIFSFIPMSFTVLIAVVNWQFEKFSGMDRNYPALFIIHMLMIFVYILIFYTFKTVYDLKEKELIAQSMKDQISLQKKQYEHFRECEETERIFRHNQRFRDSILLELLEKGDCDAAKEYISKEMTELKSNTAISFCENSLVNAIVNEYKAKADRKGAAFYVNIKMPAILACDEAEFCVMLSNLLENSLDAAKSYIKLKIKHLNSQLSVNVTNDYIGALRKDENGMHLTTKPYGSGLGLKSVDIILKNNNGFMKIDDKNGVFDVFATLKN